MPINSFLYPGAKFTPPYKVTNSCRFDDGSSDHLSQSLSSSFKSTWTWSGWVKRANLTSSGFFGNQRTDNNINSRFKLFFNSSNQIQWEIKDSTGNDDSALKTNRLFRDVSAWYHIVFIYDTTNGTAGDRLQLYVNGTRETSFATEDQAGSNFGSLWSSDLKHYVGVANGNSGLDHYFDGYMAEVVFIDGSAVAHTEFGEFDSDSPNIWKPKDVSGLTFGSDGYYLDFKNSGSLGADVSGNSNNFTVNNLTSADQTTDTCTNNYCTMLSHTLGSYATISEGNLKLVGNSSSDSGNSLSSFAFSSGKWYWEMKVSEDTASVNYPQFVVFKTTDVKYGRQNNNGADGNPATSPTHVIGMSMSDGYFSGSSFTSGTTGTSGNGDIIQFFFDMDNGAFYAGRDGTLFNSANPASGSSKTGALVTWTPDGREYAITSTNFLNSVIEFNFGNPTFSISSGNSDGNGYGNFEYDPQGYYALNSKNLAEFG